MVILYKYKMLRRNLLGLLGSAATVTTFFSLEALASGGSLEDAKVKQLRVQNGHDTYISSPAVAVPDGLGDILGKQIHGIMEGEYAHQCSDDDLFHGHFLFDNDNQFKEAFDWDNRAKERVFTLDDYFLSVRATMYHTREYLDDWVPQSDKNVPRSIVGLMNGSIRVPEIESEGYRQHGSIHGDDPFEIDGNVNQWRQETPLLRINGNLYRAFPKFQIVPYAEGRFSLKDGQKYELYLVLKDEGKEK